MYSREEIIAAARARGHGEEEIQRIIAGIDRLKQHGLVKTSGRGASVGLTREGARKVAELRAQGKIPTR
jgi:hypothetical protein